MADDFRLLAYRHMGLHVRVTFCPKLARVFATSARFEIEVMRLLAAFVDEVLREFQITWLVCDVIEFDQRQFDFLMPTVTTSLARLTTERCVAVIGIAAHDVEQVL